MELVEISDGDIHFKVSGNSSVQLEDPTCALVIDASGASRLRLASVIGIS